MHVKGMLSLGAAVVVAVALVSVSGAATAAHRSATRIDVSTRAAAVHYLSAMHVNPRGLVIQRGTRNYAGPNCPGKGWSCTRTTHPVLQVARSGGKNTFACSTAKCAVVQVAAAAAKPNKATCIKTTGLGASCTISQSSSGTTGNQALIYEDAGKLTGLTQTALYSASITQKATGSGANLACVHQGIFIDGSTKNTTSSVTVALEAHQSISIKQDSAGSPTDPQAGGNTAENAVNPSTGVYQCDGSALSQNQTLSSTATSRGAIIQNENKTGSGPNLTLDIKQNQSSGFFGTAHGPNSAISSQTNTLTAIANSPAGATQVQSSQNGGILAAVNQDSRDVSTAVATQTETQCEDAQPSGLTQCDRADPDKPSGYSLSQTQWGPVRKAPGDSRQTGNGGDSFTVTQTSNQDNDTTSGQSNVVEGGFHTDGSGTVTQTTNVDGQTSSDTQAGTGDVSGSVNCTGTSCTSTPPPTPTIDSAPPNPSDSSDATFTFHDVDATATFLCDVDGGGYSSCTSPKTYTGLADGQHTFSVEAKNPTTGAVSDPATYTWTIATSAGNANVLIAGSGDGGNSEPNDNLMQLLTGAGYSVTEQATLPADLSSFGQVWWVASTPPTSSEQTQLINFANSGKGVFLTGERSNGCCEALNAADQSMVNSIVTSGGVTVGGQDVCDCNPPPAMPVNPTVVGNLAMQPHLVTTWTPAAPGGITNVPDSSVFSYYQPSDTKYIVAAAWDRSSTVGSGRLVVFMDINWTEAVWRAANWSDVAENVAFFLSGLSSPPSPPIGSPANVQAAPAFFDAQAQTTAAAATARTAPSGPSR